MILFSEALMISQSKTQISKKKKRFVIVKVCLNITFKIRRLFFSKKECFNYKKHTDH